jgi:hypothetical protein
VPWVRPKFTNVEILIEEFISNCSILTGFTFSPSSGKYTLGYFM